MPQGIAGPSRWQARAVVRARLPAAGKPAPWLPVRTLLIMCALIPSFLRGAEDAYPRTPVGVCETKRLPAARLMLATGQGNYFTSGNRLFGRLFRYIQSNNIPMTAPVEARMEPAVMVFYCDPASAGREDLKASPEVVLQSVPERTVAAIGIRGSYTSESYAANLAKLREWLKTRADLRGTGEPYAVYWDSPFVPGFMKRSEVHIPVEPVPAPAGR